jgi:toxin ParE1/3/4
LQIEIRPGAQADLDQIFSYSLRNHGQGAADEYLGEFYLRLEQLRDHPQSAPARLGLGGVRGLSFGKHIIFYEVQPSIVVILRVLHQAMDPKGRL